MYGTDITTFTAPITSAYFTIRVVVVASTLTGDSTYAVSGFDGNGNEVSLRRAPIDYTAALESARESQLLRMLGRSRYRRGLVNPGNGCPAVASSRRPPPVDLELRLVDPPTARPIAAAAKPPLLERRRRPCEGRYCSVQT